MTTVACFPIPDNGKQMNTRVDTHAAILCNFLKMRNQVSEEQKYEDCDDGPDCNVTHQYVDYEKEYHRSALQPGHQKMTIRSPPRLLNFQPYVDFRGLETHY
jgi:hypothetical protein